MKAERLTHGDWRFAVTDVNCSQAKIGDRLFETQMPVSRLISRDLAEFRTAMEQQEAA